MKKRIGVLGVCLLMCLNVTTAFGAQANIDTNSSSALVNRTLVKNHMPVNSFTASFAKMPTANKAYTAGVSGAFSGIVGDKLILAGGLNYSGNTLQEKASKQYYKDIFVSAVNPKTKKLAWKKLGELPEAIANGASVATEEALYIIGGNNAKGDKAACIEIKIENNSLKCEAISWLPITVSHAGAAYIDDYIYVVGGIQNGVASSDVYRMHLKGDRRKWEKLPAFPEDPRIQPIVAAQRDASGKSKLYVWAGFNGWGKEAGLICGGYKYDPTTKKWSGLGAPLKNEKRVYLGGGNAFGLWDDRIVAFGGFDYEVLRNNLVKPAEDYNLHAPEWYKHNQEVYCFNTKTNKWSCLGSLPALATVHAGGAGRDNIVYNISGELKPGTNTNVITKMVF